MTHDVSRRGAMWCDVREFSGGVRVTWYEVMTVAPASRYDDEDGRKWRDETEDEERVHGANVCHLGQVCLGDK